MSSPTVPRKFQEILAEVHEPGDRVAVVAPWTGAAAELGEGVREFPAAAWESGGLPPGQDALLLLDLVPRLTAVRAGRLAAEASALVRPGGLLFVSAWSVDHPAWQNPGPDWSRTGSRELRRPATDESRFFLHAEEIVSLFAAWNVLHHHEAADGLIEAVLVKPEGRLADVPTVLYGG